MCGGGHDVVGEGGCPCIGVRRKGVATHWCQSEEVGEEKVGKGGLQTGVEDAAARLGVWKEEEEAVNMEAKGCGCLLQEGKAVVWAANGGSQ